MKLTGFAGLIPGWSCKIFGKSYRNRWDTGIKKIDQILQDQSWINHVRSLGDLMGICGAHIS